MDWCFKKEKEDKRRENMLRARESEKNFEDYCKLKERIRVSGETANATAGN
jgi:hypothetical protein